MTKRFKLLNARQDLVEEIDRLFGNPFFIDFPNWFVDQLGKIETDSDFLPHDEVEYEDGTRELRIAIANYSVEDISAEVDGRVLKIEGSKEQNHFRSPVDETEVIYAIYSLVGDSGSPILAKVDLMEGLLNGHWKNRCGL